jgi:hypothetical protein
MLLPALSRSVGVISQCGGYRGTPSPLTLIEDVCRHLGRQGRLSLKFGLFDFGKSLSLIYRDVGVRRMPRGLRQVALSISCLSPIVSRPEAFAVTKIASLIFRPERLFMVLTSFQSLRRPSLSFGSSSLISLRRQSLSLSRARLRPPGNIQSPSRFRLTRSTRPRFAATSFEDFAIP